MNINFKTHFPWNGTDGTPEPTRFREQILNVLNARIPGAGGLSYPGEGMKLHTIRRTHGRPRFREGMALTLTTGSRFKPVPFAEAVCTGVQEVHMVIEHGTTMAGRTYLSLRIAIDDQVVYMPGELALNDGFRDDERMARWFLPDIIAHGPFTGQLVHWTGVRY